MTLPDLIARVEACTGPDRELDAAIAALLAPTDDPSYAAFENGRDYPDLYTSSLDAVLALVTEKLPGWHKKLEEREPLVWIASIGRFQAEAITPALALLLALLRAIEGEK